MYRSFAVLVALTALLVITGCEEKTANVPPPSTTPAQTTAQGTSGKAQRTEPAPLPKAVPAEEFQAMMKADVPAYRAKLDALKEKVATLEGDEQKKLQTRYEELEEAYQDLSKRIGGMDMNSGYWGQVSGFLKQSWEDMKKGVDEALGLEYGAPLPGYVPPADAESDPVEGAGTEAAPTADGETTETADPPTTDESNEAPEGTTTDTTSETPPQP